MELNCSFTHFKEMPFLDWHIGEITSCASGKVNVVGGSVWDGQGISGFVILIILVGLIIISWRKKR